MNALTLVTAALAGLIHVLIFAMESVLFSRPTVHRRFGTRTEDVPEVRNWAFNQGFYNLFLAIGALAGVAVGTASSDAARTVGMTLVVFTCACMLGAALVLVATDRRMIRAATVQGLAPLLALAGAAVWG